MLIHGPGAMDSPRGQRSIHLASVLNSFCFHSVRTDEVIGSLDMSHSNLL